jgi:hypothetical protein
VSMKSINTDTLARATNCSQLPACPLEEFRRGRFKPTDLDVESLRCWNIPRKYKRTLIEQLNGLGITRRSVYPDVDGIAMSLAETQLLWGDRPIVSNGLTAGSRPGWMGQCRSARHPDTARWGR